MNFVITNEATKQKRSNSVKSQSILNPNQTNMYS